MHLWNVTFTRANRKKFYDYMNKLQPGAFNERREASPNSSYYYSPETTMVEMTEEDALMMQLAVEVNVEKLE